MLLPRPAENLPCCLPQTGFIVGGEAAVDIDLI
jgi:hypothetical protein